MFSLPLTSSGTVYGRNFECVCEDLQDGGHSQCMVKEVVHNAAAISLHSQVLLGAASREKVFPNALRQRAYVVKILIMLTDLPQGYTHTELH